MNAYRAVSTICFYVIHTMSAKLDVFTVYSAIYFLHEGTLLRCVKIYAIVWRYFRQTLAEDATDLSLLDLAIAVSYLEKQLPSK